jgi:MFS transporter, FLVCR family, feline leukemia virus subgroup C receptor-related protein
MYGTLENGDDDLEHPQTGGKGSTPQHRRLFQVYPQRWLMLALFAALTMTNAMVWISFAPISSPVRGYYGISKLLVNMLSMIFMALYIPGSLLANYLFAMRGTRFTLCTGAVLTAAGCAIRIASTKTDTEAAADAPYAWLMLGQCLAALAQPVFTNAPARIASEWFASEQRDTATVIGAMSNPIGIALGELIPTFVVSGTYAVNSGMRTLLIVEAGIAGGACLLVLLLFRERPPTPPSAASEARQEQAMDDEAVRRGGVCNDKLIGDIKACFGNKNFVILFTAFGLGLAIFNGLTTVIAQLVEPDGYTKDDAGLFGALIIGCGLVGSAIAAPILDSTKKYNEILRALYLMAGASGVFFVLALRPGHKALVASSFGAMGFFMLPLLPVTFQCGVECTYPVPEDVSSGLLMFSGNLTAMATIFAMDALISDEPYSTVFTKSSILFIVIMILSVSTAQFYKGPYNRMQHELEHNEKTKRLVQPTSSEQDQSSSYYDDV